MGTASLLAHTTTGGYGQFSFPANAYTYANVDSTQYAYMTVVGGNAGHLGREQQHSADGGAGFGREPDLADLGAEGAGVHQRSFHGGGGVRTLSNFITDTSGIVNVGRADQ